MHFKNFSFPKIAVILLAGLGFIAYANSFANPFIWDDFELVTNNDVIQSFSHFPQLFTGNVVTESSFYRPLQMLSYMFDHEIWGMNANGFHFTSTIIHIGVSAALCWVFFLLTQNTFMALVAAALFVVHPVHTEAVTYISGRADPLAALFMLITFALYLKYEKEQRLVWLVYSGLSFVCAVLSKEYALILPVLLVVYHFTFQKKMQWRVWSVLAGVSILFVILRMTGVLGVVDMHTKTQTSIAQRLPGTFEAIVQYVRLIFVPTNLTMGYGQKMGSFTSPIVLIGLLLLIGLIGGVLYVRKKNALIAFGLLWFVVGLIPVMNIYPVNAYMAEHWLYVPSMGMIVIVAWAIERLWQSQRTLAYGCVVICIGALTFLTIQQNFTWRDPAAFYQRIVDMNPTFLKAYNNLGKIYAESNRCEEAIPVFQKAIAIQPRFIKAYNNAAVCLAQLGQKEEAIRYYQQALNMDSDFVPTYNNVGVLFMENKNFDQARQYFSKAIALDPNEQKTHFNLGVLAEMQENYEEAAQHYQKALAINPYYRQAHNNLAGVMSRRSQKDQAIAYYQQLIANDPDNEVAYNNLGVIYMHQGRLDEAVEQFGQALSKKRDYAEAHYNIGTVFYRKKSLGQAMRHLQDAIRIDPEHEGALTNLGIVYAMQNKFDLAEQMFQRALDFNADDVSIYNNIGLIQARQGRFDEAIANYQAAIAKNPTHKESHSNLALAYEKQGDLALAKEYYQKTIALDPRFVNALNGLGVIHARQEDYQTAAQFFQQVIDIQPTHRDANANLKRAQALLAQEIE